MTRIAEGQEGRGRVLLADDEPTFLLSTAELLRKHGFQVTTARDGFQALRFVEEGGVDALVSDILMPGNEHLDFIRKACASDPLLMVVLVTAHPALQTAIDAIHLPVAAYLLKPVGARNLVATVGQVVKEARIRRVLAASEERIVVWNQGLEAMRNLAHAEAEDGQQDGTWSFLRMAVGNLAGALVDVGTLLDLVQEPVQGGSVCAVQNCPRMASTRKVVAECVAALEKTRTAFKSRSLAEIRTRLEGLVRD